LDSVLQLLTSIDFVWSGFSQGNVFVLWASELAAPRSRWTNVCK
jgi:hypothetical protein